MNYDSERGRGKRIVEFVFNNIFNNSRGEGSLFSLVPVFIRYVRIPVGLIPWILRD